MYDISRAIYLINVMYTYKLISMDRPKIRKITRKSTAPIFLCLHSRNQCTWRFITGCIYSSCAAYPIKLQTSKLSLYWPLKFNILLVNWCSSRVEYVFLLLYHEMVPQYAFFFYQNRKFVTENMINAVCYMAESMDLFGDSFYCS